MSENFETLKTNELFNILEQERHDAFENEQFFQSLKNLSHLSKDWTFEKKTQFISSILFSFEGVSSWFHIAADGWDRIFGLAGEKWVKKLKGLKLISQAFSDIDTPETQRLRYIISEAERIKKRRQNPIYNLNQKPKIIFKDFGFKLAVINHLMYDKKILRPVFNINLFAEEYINKETGYGINLDWYRASPEAGKYLFNLDIPKYLLNNITTLKLDKNAEIYRGVVHPVAKRLNPKYLNDGYEPIGDDAIEDLTLLPNLEEIHLIGKNKFEWGQDKSNVPMGVAIPRDDLSVKFVEALKKQKIKLQTEEDIRKRLRSSWEIREFLEN